MVRLNIISHNVWLIPFAGPWFLGRAARCAENMAAATAKLQQQKQGQEDVITVVALQEVWAMRAGMFWPILWLCSYVEQLLLQLGIVNGGYEPMLYRMVKGIGFFLLIVSLWLEGDLVQRCVSAMAGACHMVFLGPQKKSVYYCTRALIRAYANLLHALWTPCTLLPFIHFKINNRCSTCACTSGCH